MENQRPYIPELDDIPLSPKQKRKKYFIRTTVMLLFTAVSFLLFCFRIKLPLISNMFSVEFSALPETIINFVYGPIYGVAVCLLKNVIHTAVYNQFAIIDFTNFLIETTYLIVTGALCKKVKGSSNTLSIKAMTVCSLLGIVCALAVQFFATSFQLYPILANKFPGSFTSERILQSYTDSLDAVRTHLPRALGSLIPHISHIWQGVILINLPMTFVKLLLITPLAAVIQYGLSRLNKKDSEQESVTTS